MINSQANVTIRNIANCIKFLMRMEEKYCMFVKDTNRMKAKVSF